jgi:Ca2+-binding RTX toxin-like protein
VSVGGDTTDTDVSLGRQQSESIYYLASAVELGGIPSYAFVDSNNKIIGFASGAGTWLMTPKSIQGADGGVFFSTIPGINETAHFNFTAVAVENDGDLDTNQTDFDVAVSWLGVGPGTSLVSPLVPICDIGMNIGLEDVDLTLNVTAMAQETDLTSPTVSVVISNVHPGVNVTGAYLNTVTRNWVAMADAVTAGNVKITPPVDWSGSMDIKIECIATTWYSLFATTGGLDADLYFDPVADGVRITVPNLDGIEDQPIALDVTLELTDTDGSEEISSNGYVLVSAGATLDGGYELVGSSADDALVDGTSLEGYYRVPVGDLSTLVLQPDENWSGTFTVRAAAYSTEIFDDEDGNHLKLSLSRIVNVKVEAVADPPVVTVPVEPVVGLEDADILIPSLSAITLASDTATEIISVVISGAPQGSIFSAGSNSGGQRWSIPVASLTNIAIRPPAHYAGIMTLTFTAIAMEPSNGSEAQTSQDFIVDVTPIADDVIIVAKNIALGSSGVANMDLNVQMYDTRGTIAGEIGPEIITLAFGNVQNGVFFHASLGGKIAEIGSGVWDFTGTQEQANALQVVSGPNLSPTTQTITISGITIDGDSFLDPPVLDDFILTVTQPSNIGLTLIATNNSSSAANLTGAAGNDVLTGGNGNDILSGGAGMDRLSGLGGDNQLTGGSGADQFIISPGSIDTITDFDASEGDQVDVSSLLEMHFKLQQDDVSDFVQLAAVNGPNVTTAIKVSATGSGTNYATVVLLQGVTTTGLTLEDMIANGNLIVAHSIIPLTTEASQVNLRYLKNEEAAAAAARDLVAYEVRVLFVVYAAPNGMFAKNTISSCFLPLLFFFFFSLPTAPTLPLSSGRAVAVAAATTTT